jgi:DNA-binding response OmpR family regulator
MGADAVSTSLDRSRDPSAGASVLVVDDDPFIGRLLEIELRAAGFEVRASTDGSTALELALERCPHVVIVDVMMPTMDGFELTRRLRQDERTAAVGVIMLSALGQRTDRTLGLDVGADDYVVKPFEIPELVARIHDVLLRAGGRRN